MHATPGGRDATSLDMVSLKYHNVVDVTVHAVWYNVLSLLLILHLGFLNNEELEDRCISSKSSIPEGFCAAQHRIIYTGYEGPCFTRWRRCACKG